MTSFVDGLAGDAAAIVAEQGIPGAYNTLGVTPGVNVTLIFDPLSRAPSTTPDGRIEFTSAAIQTTIAATPAPDSRDTFTVNGVTYAVVALAIQEWIVEWQVESIAQHRFGGEASHVQR